MRRRRAIHKISSSIPVEHDDLVCLWSLRLLVPLGGHKKFITSNGFDSDGLAESIGMGAWLDPDGEEFDPRKAYAALRQLHAEAERELEDARIPETLHRNMGRLAKQIGLDEVSARILEFAVIIKTNPTLEGATETIDPMSSSKMYTVLSVLLEIPEASIKSALSTSGQLARTGLLKIDHRGLFSLSNKIDMISESMPFYMNEETEDPLTLLKETVVPCTKPILGLQHYLHIQRDLNVIVPYLRQAVTNRCQGVNIYVHGSPGTGKSQFARVLAKELGIELFEVAKEDSDGEAISGERRLRALRAAQSILADQPSLLLFDEVEDIFGDATVFIGKRSTAQEHKGWLNNVLEVNPVPTIWLSNSAEELDPAFVRRFDMVFELPIPTRKQRERITYEFCNGLIPHDAIARIVEADNLAPAVIERAVKVVRSIQNELPQDQLSATVERLISHTLTTQGHAPLKKHDPNRLPEWYDPNFINADTDLEDIANGLASHRSGRICLYGPPGTGKTAYARWLAEKLELPLLAKRGSDLLSKWVGGTEANIAQAFNEAESEEAILLIDEVDSFLQDRRDANRSWEVTQVNEMLTQMESFAGIFIASTNLMHGMDQASLRRFDLKLKFDYLQPEQAWQMFEKQCSALELEQPEHSLRSKVDKLTVLTPGDFAAAARQHRFRSIKSPHILLSALEGECSVKEGGQRRSIGFI